MQIQISWLLQKPTDLDLHCLQRQGISGFSMTSVNTILFFGFVRKQDLKFPSVWSNHLVGFDGQFHLERISYLPYHIRPNISTYPISTQSSNSVVFRLQQVYFLYTSLQRHMLWVLIWIASTCWCNSNENRQHTGMLLQRNSEKNRINIISQVFRWSFFSVPLVYIVDGYIF